MSLSVRIRPATPEDAEVLVTLIRELAEYEKLLDEADPDVDRLRRHLRPDAQPQCEALIAETVADEESESGGEPGGKPVGFALYFANYSTFLTRFGIYLEDLFVRPAYRGRGVGFRLLQRVAQTAAERGCERLDWAVLDWNDLAIDFYRQLGAEPLDDWTTMRLSGDKIRDLAEQADP